MRAVFLIAWLVASSSYAQNGPDSLWIQPYGAGSACRADAIRLTADHGYILVGTESTPSGDEARAVRIDSNGHLLWSREYCGTWSLKARDIRQAPGGDILIAGTAVSLTADSERAFLIRTTEQGDTLWLRVYGDSACGVHAVLPTADGGCVPAGWAIAADSSESDIFLSKINRLGGIVWQHKYAVSGTEWPAVLQETGEGGWMIAGQGMTEDGTEMLHVIQTDSAGGLQWSRSFPMRGLLRLYGLEQTSTGGLVIAGLRNPPTVEPCGFFLLKMDSSGDLNWFHSYRAECDPAARVMLRATLSGFLIATHNVSLCSGLRELSILKTDENGELQYRVDYSGTGFVLREVYGSYRYYAKAASFGAGMYDFFVDPHPPIAESISIRPPVPHPERSERHGPHDSFGNVYWAEFTLNHRQPVNVSVYDAHGKLIRTVADGEYCAGPHCEIFDGWSLPPGIYFLRVETRNMHQTRKVVLVR